MPVEDHLTLYLLVESKPDGGLAASIRNPELNFGRDGPYLVHVEGSTVRLVDSASGADRIRGTYDRGKDRLSLTLHGDLHVELSRRTRRNAPGFYPATSPDTSFTYHRPVGMNDGWPTGSLADVGLDLKPLGKLVERILTTPYSGFGTPYIHSLLIARHGKLVLERYFYGFHAESTHDMRSASKTFAGVLIGLASHRTKDFSLDAPIRSILPEYDDVVDENSLKAEIKIRDLLTMTSGLACDDNDENSPGNEDRMQSQQKQPDWCRFTLSLPMARKPGLTTAVYCSGAVNVLGALVRHLTKQPVPEFFYEHWAKPLRLRTYHINLMPNGKAYLGGGMRMRPRDQLKLGQVYLNGGMWNGHRIVDGEWVRDSLREYSNFTPTHGYGFTWHIIDLESSGETYRVYEAGGNGGQFVLMIPSLDMVVGFTGGNYGDFRTWNRFMTELVPQYIIPAAESGQR